MTIWLDADACPVAIREILFRAAERTQTPLVLVANHYLKTPASKVIRFYHVEKGFDKADDWIVSQVKAGDLVVCSDIPLAHDAIEQGAFVVSPRGDEFTKANIKARLTMRDFMETMRASGVQTGGPSALSQADKQAFANYLDRWLAQHAK